MANNQKLYNMFSQYSDAQLQQVLQARNYNQNAKAIAYDILMQRNPGAYPSAPAAPVAEPVPAQPYGAPASPFDNPYAEVPAAPAAPAGPIDFQVNAPTYAAPSAPEAPAYGAPAAPAYGAPAAPAYGAPAAPAAYPVDTAYNAKNSKLYNKFCMYSDMQLQQILMARNYSQEAKLVANSILQERGSVQQAEPVAQAPVAQTYSAPVEQTVPAEVAGAYEDSAAVNDYTPETAVNPNAEEIVKKYGELLELGAITQEEFEEKKKQFLGQ